MDQSSRRRPFTRQHSRDQQRTGSQHPPGIRGNNPRHSAANARNNYERYTTLAKDAARRGEVIEAENFYQHAEHYFRVMREQD